MLYFLQEKLIFMPTTLAHDYEYTFSKPFQEFNLFAEDGAQLNGLHFKAERPKGVILYFHGNAGDLSRWGEIASFFVDKQYDVIVMDYRKYGKSTGKLSEKVLYTDAQLFYDYSLQHYEEHEITVYGRSLGTGIATQIASVNKPNKLILETPYYSLVSLAKNRFSFLPIESLLKYKIPSHKFIQQVACAIVIFHGTDDRIVPYSSGKRLYESIPHSKKQMITINGGAHNNLIQFDAYLQNSTKVLE
ncbi:alpha/beta hydrolase [Cellulophaga sp. F20128]|uniref:alpha/beta hydrolase n=1 Tax=Cellulophaga sp. F20128 TaxID=2926413 RepID=UPI001FF56CEF|nr:alpha/beta hydrolase [Cellulophaga sp. F20128]MCK0157891.1 alpha/beta hydrolase [Cellulophaga sp. F20128]